MFDRTSRIIKTLAISFCILLLSSVIVVVFLNMKNNEDKKEETKYVGTTSRRTYKTTSSTSSKTTTSILYTEDEPTLTTTVTTTLAPLPTTVPTTTKNTTTAKGTTTTKKTTKKTTRKTTKKTTKKTTTTEPVQNDDREVTISPSTHELAIDEWEWGIVDLINEERASLGYEPLQVAVDLRDLAEYAADYWYDHSNDVIDDIIGNNSYYGTKLINANYIESYKYLYDKTLSNTDVTTNPGYSYIGVGVIYRAKGDTGMRTHYYIIIYE